MSFVQSLTGLYGASSALDVIGANIANTSTAGYKGSRAEFGDIFASYLQTQAHASGLGATVSPVQQFTQGNIQTSQNMLDFSINGNGMFQVSSDAAAEQRIAYTRNGEFHFVPVTGDDGTVTGARYLVNANGNYLMGWGADEATTGTPSVLQIAPDLAPNATTTSTLRVNLDDRAEDLSATTFDPDDPSTFNWSTSQTIYSGVADDTTAHQLSLYFVKTGVADTWNVYTRIDGNVPAEEAAGGRQLTFSSGGLLLSGSPLTSTATVNATSETADPLTGAVTTVTTAVPLSLTIDLSNSTQFAVKYDAGQSLQDGYADGSLSDLHVLSDGTLEGQFSNGLTQSLGTVALATFMNPNGLKSVGDNLWMETANSGAANLGTATTGGRGAMASYSLEASNVDLSAQLVEMITMQRNYQANAQSIKTQDDVLRTLTGLR